MNQRHRILMTPPSHQIPVAAPEPYPPPRVEGPNPVYARLLIEDISSAKGELTTICQYLYQSWIPEEGCEELAETLLRIAETEMRHLHLLGELIVQLGGDPKFCIPVPLGGIPPGRQPNPTSAPQPNGQYRSLNSFLFGNPYMGNAPNNHPNCGNTRCNSNTRNSIPWNGNMVSYHKGTEEILTGNILLELASIETYTYQAKLVTDELLSAILLRISQDEIIHKGIFETWLAKFTAE